MTNQPQRRLTHRSKERKAEYDDRRIQLSETATDELQLFARQHRLTVNTLAQGAWALLLSRYSGDDDVLFGVTVSGRPGDLAWCRIDGRFVHQHAAASGA